MRMRMLTYFTLALLCYCDAPHAPHVENCSIGTSVIALLSVHSSVASESVQHPWRKLESILPFCTFVIRSVGCVVLWWILFVICYQSSITTLHHHTTINQSTPHLTLPPPSLIHQTSPHLTHHTSPTNDLNPSN